PLVAADIADAGLQQRLGDGQDAFAPEHLAGAQPQRFHFPFERAFHGRCLLFTPKPVGWVERSETHAFGRCDGFRNSSTHPTNYYMRRDPPATSTSTSPVPRHRARTGSRRREPYG